MNLKETLYEIDRAMKHNSEYSGILPTHANALTTYGLLHNETVEARNPTRLRFGILENHAMISGVTRTGEDRLIMLAPAPTEIEEGAAILTSTGVVIAAYTNHLDDYESVAAWDTINLVEPKRRDLPRPSRWAARSENRKKPEWCRDRRALLARDENRTAARLRAREHLTSPRRG